MALPISRSALACWLVATGVLALLAVAFFVGFVMALP